MRFILPLALVLFAAPAFAEDRPKALPPLYFSFAALQVADIHTTIRALDNGAVEANPLLKGIADSPVKLGLVKVAGTAALFTASEALWRKGKKKTAIVLMIAGNVGMTAVVYRNYQIGGQR